MGDIEKTTMPWPNVANRVHDWLKSTWPELVKVPYAWFTGSSVWRFLYDEPLREGADLDMFVTQYTLPPEPLPEPGPVGLAAWLPDTWRPQPNRLGDENYCLAPIERALAHLQIPEHGARPPGLEHKGGRILWTSRGRVGYWMRHSPGINGAWEQLGNYPGDTHGHCKAAYSFFHNMLLVKTNVWATDQGAYELAERQMLTAEDRLKALRDKL